jgi:cytochrome c-type biogenesis protein CcmE
MGNKNTLALAVIALGAIVAFKYMQKQMVPYVPFAEAMAKGEYVQIIGSIDRTRGVTVSKNGISFMLTDAKGAIEISYEGDKPLNFDEAEKVVALGTYDKATRQFRADKILTKCPSKYEKKKK